MSFLSIKFLNLCFFFCTALHKLNALLVVLKSESSECTNEGLAHLNAYCYLKPLFSRSGVARISKLGKGHTGDVAQRADKGMGFMGRGSATGPSPSAKRSVEELSLPPPPPPKKSRICTNPVAMPVDGRGRAPPVSPWLRYCCRGYT